MLADRLDTITGKEKRAASLHLDERQSAPEARPRFLLGKAFVKAKMPSTNQLHDLGHLAGTSGLPTQTTFDAEILSRQLLTLGTIPFSEPPRAPMTVAMNHQQNPLFILAKVRTTDVPR